MGNGPAFYFDSAVPSSNYRAAAKELVKQNLRDPNSAEFSEMRVIEGTAGRATIVWSKVKARNGFGGMTGAKRFVVGDTVSLEDEVGEVLLISTRGR